MKFLVVAIMFCSVGCFATILTAPACYKGTFTTKDDSRDVVLIFAPKPEAHIDGSVTYFVNSFTVGAQKVEAAGMTGSEDPNFLRFNYNDDYFPYGNATLNLDITLHANKLGNSLTGTYKYYQGATYGGFGMGGAHLLVDGVLKLESTLYDCPYLKADLAPKK